MSALEEFNEIQKRLENFTTKFDRKLSEQRSNILKDKESFGVEMNDMKSQQAKLTEEIKIVKTKEELLSKALSKDSESLQTSKLKVNELTNQKDQLEANRLELSHKIEELNSKIATKNNELMASKNNLSNQIKNDLPELRKYENFLGLKIDSIKNDYLVFFFNNVDPDNYLREVSVELDVSSEDYVIGKTNPTISNDSKTKIENDFNGHRELVKFLKQVRTILKENL